MPTVRRSHARVMFATVAAIQGCVWFSPSASADIRPPNAPDKAPAAEPRIVVQRAAYLSKSQLIIPRKFLPGEKVGDASSSNRTIVAGTALAAGFALCGLVFLRRHGLGRSTIVASVAVGGLLIGSACVVANAPAPPYSAAGDDRGRPRSFRFDRRRRRFDHSRARRRGDDSRPTTDVASLKQ